MISDPLPPVLQAIESPVLPLLCCFTRAGTETPRRMRTSVTFITILRTFPMPKLPSTAAAHPPIGTLIDNGSLELVEVLGVGGYGVVYRAVDIHSAFPKSFAVKCLVDAYPHQNSRQRQVHIREIALHQLASVHPNIVTLHRVIEEYHYTYLVMDYACDGDLFTQILHNCRYLGDDYLIKRVFLQLLDAVEYCHSLGIYHRDLKPENVLCFDGGLHVAITDFGLATTDKESAEFRTGSVYHMSPECQGGEFAPTGSYSPMFNDIWSLAIILLNLATGRNPWKSASASDPTFQAYLQDPTNFLPTVLPISHELNAILVQMLEVDWQNRMTLSELRNAFKDVDNFYSDGVVFEGSMARCPWEAGMDIESDSSTKGESPRSNSNNGLKSRWSKDSALESDIISCHPSMTEKSSTYGPWPEFSSCAATWGLESPTSSIESQHILPNIDGWQSQRTASVTYTPTTPSVGSVSSLPVTPNGVDLSFRDRVNIAAPKPLTLDTNCGRFRENLTLASFSSASSMMQTAIDYGPYSSSFLIASPVSTSKTSLAIPSAVEFEDEEDDKDMETWEYAATEMSYSSVDSQTKNSITCHEIVCDNLYQTVENGENDDLSTQAASEPISRDVMESITVSLEMTDFSSVVNGLPESPLKRLNGIKSRGTLFKLFPRSPRSSASISRGSAVRRTRTPSPPLKQPWTFMPSRPRTPAATMTQDGDCRRSVRLLSKRHWFSPSKFFATTAS